jgi:hypothetical protein
LWLPSTPALLTQHDPHHPPIHARRRLFPRCHRLRPRWFHATVPGRRHCRSLVPSGNEQGVKGGRSAPGPFHPLASVPLIHGAAGQKRFAPPDPILSALPCKQVRSVALPLPAPLPRDGSDQQCRAAGALPRNHASRCEHTSGRTNRACPGWVGCCCLRCWHCRPRRSGRICGVVIGFGLRYVQAVTGAEPACPIPHPTQTTAGAPRPRGEKK